MERRAWMGIALPIWVLVSFVSVQIVIYLLLNGLDAIGVPFGEMNQAVLNSITGVVIYGLTIGMVVGVPWWLKKYRTSTDEIGLKNWPRWLDLLLAPAGFLVYLLISGLLVWFAMQYLTFIDFQQTQDTGFSGLSQRYEYILAFLTLVVIAPVAEEVLFRGYLFGKLRKYVPLWVAILITSVLFAFVHGAWNVAIDVFALSIVLCVLRVVANSLWPSILLHMIKNFIAFYLLFINPTLLSTLGG